MQRLFQAAAAAMLIASIAASGCSRASNEQQPERPAPAAGVLYVTVVLQDRSGQPMPSVEVTIASGGSADRKTTGPSGRAALRIAEPKGSPLDFTFTADSIRWTDTVNLLPPGVREATIFFTVDKTGKVLFTRLEY